MLLTIIIISLSLIFIKLLRSVFKRNKKENPLGSIKNIKHSETYTRPIEKSKTRVIELKQHNYKYVKGNRVNPFTGNSWSFSPETYGEKLANVRNYSHKRTNK